MGRALQCGTHLFGDSHEAFVEELQPYGVDIGRLTGVFSLFFSRELECSASKSLHGPAGFDNDGRVWFQDDGRAGHPTTRAKIA